ncbi:MAG: DUF1573 domain-containing protein [Bacteroidota bacterium]
MKNLLIILSAFALIFTSCSSDLEKRVADLERRTATLERGGTSAANSISGTNSIAQPVSTNPSISTASNAAPETKPDGPVPTFAFSKESHDFGTIQEGDVVNEVFTFTNNGEAPLIIESARGSCGCTVPQWPKDPIPVGGTGEIQVSFNSKGKPGVQNKTVTITANTYPKITKLSVKANVQKAETTTASTSGPVKN